MLGQSSIMNSQVELQLIYKEEIVPVEFEVPGPECVVCVTASFGSCNIFLSRTAISGTPLHAFLSKFTNTELPFCPEFGKYICRRCLHLVNDLEKAEIEYVKMKTTFESIISRNPLFHLPVRLETMKEQNPLDSGDDESNLTNKGIEMYVAIEAFPKKKICDDGNTLFLQEPVLADGNDSNSSSEEYSRDTGKSFYGEDTGDEYSPNGKHRSQAKKTGPKCTICQRQFTCRRNLQRHLQIHYDKKSYECHICQRRFNVDAYLKTHLKTHSVHECSVCQSQFNSKSSYESHVVTHLGDLYGNGSVSSHKYAGLVRCQASDVKNNPLSENRNGSYSTDDAMGDVNTYVPTVEAGDGNG